MQMKNIGANVNFLLTGRIYCAKIKLTKSEICANVLNRLLEK